MTLSTDTLLDRIKMKARLRRWRLSAIILGTLLLVSLVGKTGEQLSLYPGQDYIARIGIYGIIDNSREQLQSIADIASNDDIKAVIVHIDSPGGTAVGGEVLYEALKDLREKKPVVAVMGNLATSAGYLIAVPTSRIFAHKATVTGSIGVMIQSPNVVELAKKIGISVDVIKTGNLKGSPSFFEDLSPEGEAVLKGVVMDFYDVFVEMITEHRDIPRESVVKLADGRIFTGLQALENKLVDEIGGENEAIEWLQENKNIKHNLKVRDVPLYKQRPPWKEFITSTFGSNTLIPKEFSLHGLLSLWQNSVIQP